MTTTNNIVSRLKEDDQDFEWYPTTTKILDAIKIDLEGIQQYDSVSMLDCGAGDGRALKHLTKGKKYAIEKSLPLLELMSKDIYVIGTEFNEQTLIDKKVDVVFSNPPYKHFADWACKIILEANANTIYLVMPERWVGVEGIVHAIKSREAEYSTLGTYDFLEADRAARVTVEVVKIQLGYNGRWGRGGQRVDPFELWFNTYFNIKAQQSELYSDRAQESSTEDLEERIERGLVAGSDIISVLYKLYSNDKQKLLNNYKRLEEIDSVLLDELGVNVEGVIEALQKKIEGLKDLYWHELFSNFNKVTDRLTVRSRKLLLETLTKHTHIDFTESNCHAVAIWVIKNANTYFDSQLIDVVESLTSKANIQLYKSNKRTFGDEEWRYCRKPKNLDKYLLDYRIVVEHQGGLSCGTFDRSVNGLAERGANFLDDLCVIAACIGFDTMGMSRAKDFEWRVHKKNNFMFKDISTGEETILFEAKAFKNGNLHIKFDQSFICKLNVEFGRLKGWLKSPKDCADELDVSMEQAVEAFGSNIQLGVQTNNLLPLIK